MREKTLKQEYEQWRQVCKEFIESVKDDFELRKDFSIYIGMNKKVISPIIMNQLRRSYKNHVAPPKHIC